MKISTSFLIRCLCFLIVSAGLLSAQKRSTNVIIVQAEIASSLQDCSTEEWPYPKPPEGWKGLDNSGIKYGGFSILEQQYNSLSTIRVTLRNGADAAVDIPLNSLADAKVRRSNSQLYAPAVGMYWKAPIPGGFWGWWTAVSWDKPITMILPAGAEAKLCFFFPTATPGEMFSLAAVGEVRIHNASDTKRSSDNGTR